MTTAAPPGDIPGKKTVVLAGITAGCLTVPMLKNLDMVESKKFWDKQKKRRSRISSSTGVKTPSWTI